MAAERKTVMVSVRLPATVVARADFIARNTDGDVKNRSIAVLAALEAWLPEQEQRLEKLGILAKKVR